MSLPDTVVEEQCDIQPVPLDAPVPEPVSPVDFYLRQQQQLTAVERFSQDHTGGLVPSMAKYYSQLMPASPPGPGEQYAFEVDLDRCSGCKACVTACHSQNGLDDGEAWRDVGLLQGGTSELPVMQHVTAACHHCLDPACLNVCPVDAYEKDPVTGIVKHLDDQCFGCQYCTLACPYDVPKYNAQKGIVRKCDMCSDRLADGEAPACVQACPNQAIAINVVNRQDVVESSETNLFLPGAPEPSLTLPTTTYKTERPLPRNLLPADFYSVRKEHAHLPLVVMLVLTQLSVGAFAVEQFMNWQLERALVASVAPLHSASAVLFGLLAIGASVFHLGRPLYAFRAIIGLTHSWLSREILAFGAFAALAVAYAATLWLPDNPSSAWLPQSLGTAVVVAGLAGVGCSIMIYQCTRRVFWNGTAVSVKFLLTTLVLGIAAAWLTLMLAAVWSESSSARLIVERHGRLLCQGLMAAALAKLAFEAAVFRHLRAAQNTSMKRSARLMTGELTNATLARFCCGFLGGAWMPGFLLMGDSFAGDPSGWFLTVVVAGLFVACLVGELLERYLFFTAVVAPKMPGGV